MNAITAMLEPYALLKFLHIVMAGLWLGMDMGVYLAAQRMRNAKLSIETRRAMGGLSGILDMGPRSALVLLLMLGITLTYLGGWGFPGGYGGELAATAALAGVVWLAGIWHQYWVDHPGVNETRPASHIKFQQGFRRADIMLRVIITAALAAVAVWSLIGDGPIVATWLQVKLILFALIVSCGIGIRLYLPHTRAALAEIFTHGSTPEREASLVLHRTKALFFVKSIWTLVAIIIWVSVSKF